MDKKLKGFTIIELMVVITIIAVLASISVPAAMIWVKDARLRDANEEARLVYSAVQDYLTELEIKNIELKVSGSPDEMIFYSCSYDDTLAAYVSGATKEESAEYGAFYSGAAVNGLVRGKAISFADVLTDDFQGVWQAKINMDTYTVKEVCWTPYVGTPTIDNDPANGFSFDSVADQEDYMNHKGIAIGKFPV